MNFLVTILDKLPLWALLLISASSVVAGDFFAKYWSIHLRGVFYFLAVLSYMSSSIFFIPTLLKEGLIVSSVLWSVLSIIGFVLVGLLIFKETLSGLETVGVALGIASLILLSMGK